MMNAARSIEARAKKNAGYFDFDPLIKHNFSDSLYAKEMTIPAGAEIISHKHSYAHLSILASGLVIVRTDEKPGGKVYQAPACIEIKAGIHHAIHALNDSVWFCIHATDEKDANNVDQVLIQQPKSPGE